MNYNRLYNFHVLAVEGSLKDASAKLNITASTISEQIKLLEEFFENDLFTRKKGRLQISPFGLQVFQYSSTIFDTGDRLLQALTPEKTRVPNILEIDTTSLIIDICPTSMIHPLAGQDYTLRLNQGDFTSSFKRLQSFEVDIIISEDSSLSKHARSIEKIKLRDINFYCCLGTELYESKEEWTVNDLNDISRIAYSHQLRMRYNADNFLRESENTSSISVETNEIKLIKDATINNLGFSFLPEAIVKINSKKLRIVFPKPIFKVGIYSYTSKDEKRTIIKHVIQQLKN